MADTQNTTAPYTLQDIWQFPVKGFPGRRCESVEVEANKLLPADRRFAISNGHPASHQKLDQGWLSKRHFVQLLSEARLASLSLDTDEETGKISLKDKTGVLAEAPLNDAEPVMARLQAFLPERFDETPRLCRLDTGGYTDTDAPWITLGGSASLADFGAVTHTPPDNRRFRLNLIINTATPFEEFDWAGKTICIGTTELEVIEPVGRCAAINVDPDTTQREDDYLRVMRQLYGHTDLGMFAKLKTAGTLQCGAEVIVPV